ncbi:LOW QUALITY PROTEIN: terpene synthase 10-like [Carica papaya]|uniref:LOW QUALITY PROTEIN: terpene synthase 10-like n=1 Tax=Carica papaya TaxID=3649 RepID=UPI000B8CE1B1|nr:LOW QUALITY PROTEIN: terpene synthase 10-like [Carica papaya]
MGFRLLRSKLPVTKSPYKILFAPLTPSSFISHRIISRSFHSTITNSIDISNPQPPNSFRRSANYQPCIWNYDYIQSLTNDYKGDSYNARVHKLILEVSMMLKEMADVGEKLDLIDSIQRLGISYHFDNEISSTMKYVSDNYYNNGTLIRKDLYGAALEFRLLRQYGCYVSQEVFKNFMEEWSFKSCQSEDTWGMLSLYEASYLSVPDEAILYEVQNFTTEHLRKYMKKENNINEYLRMLVEHALELPLQWRIQRVEARWFIDAYKKKLNMNSIVLELAKLDFNIVQATHQEELKHGSRWWMNMNFHKKVTLFRDRLMEIFFFTIGIMYEPQFGYYREIMTKVSSLITILDDIYDVYGTLDEIKLFTQIVNRWDINAIGQLPDYMKICFVGLYNTINEIVFNNLKEQEINIVPQLKQLWADYCESESLEARWFYEQYIPSLEEYLENAWVSISGPLILMHIHILMKPITKGESQSIVHYPKIIRLSSIIFRLMDDLATSSAELERGDVSKSIQCYMHEAKVSEEDAREHIKYLVKETWKMMNEERLTNNLMSKTLYENAMNVARIAQCMYLHGDGFGVPDAATKDHVLSLIIQPFTDV